MPRPILILIICFSFYELSAFSEEIEIYRSIDSIKSLEIDLLQINVQVHWLQQDAIVVRLVGEGAREFPHKIRYRKNSGVLSIGEELALGKRISDFWENRDMVKIDTPIELTMIIEIPQKIIDVPYRFKVLLGNLEIQGNGVKLRHSLYTETLRGFILVQDLYGLRLVAKSAHGNINLTNIAFWLVEIHNIYGNIDISWMKSTFKIFLRAGQLSGGATIDTQKYRLPLQLETVGIIGDSSQTHTAELELRTGYGRVNIVT